MKRANYGIDAPRVVLVFVILAVIGVGGLVVIRIQPGIAAQSMPVNLGVLFFYLAVLGIVWAGGFLWSSKYGKLRVRNKIIGSIPWLGDETVLDVGCDGGLMLIGAAKRLKSGGKAVGVDIWNPGDQSGNRPETALQNAKVEGVADKIELKTGDARKLPFPDSSFDLVLSSLVLHNIPGKDERKKAVLEIARVLKPSGRVAVFDMFRTDEYEDDFREAGMVEVGRMRTAFLFFIPCHTVTAKKPT